MSHWTFSRLMMYTKARWCSAAFRSISLPCHAERGDDQHLPNQKAVQAQVEQGGEGDDALAEAHIKQDSGDGMRQDEVGGKGLIIMGTVSH